MAPIPPRRPMQTSEMMLLCLVAIHAADCTHSSTLQSSFSPWRDCSLKNDGHIDPLSFGPHAVTVDRTSSIRFPTYRPTNLSAADRWPVFVFMHGSGSDDRFLSPSLSRWASHGFIVIAPLMGTEAMCANPLEDYFCSDHSSDGRFILDALQWINSMNREPTSDFYSHVDGKAVAIGGWSMGGVSAIKAAAAMPAGAISAVVLASPSVEFCGLLYNYSQAEIEEDWQKALNATMGHAPWFLYTATDDILQPATLKLFDSGRSDSIYAQYKAEYCARKPPFLNTTIWPAVWEAWPGFREHCCSGLVTMTAWTTTFLKFALQNQSAECSRMLWARSDDSIDADLRMESVKRRME
eukprot:SAG31_NODE_588_length_13820_cov_47.352452_5_plen_352_part_00